MLNSARKGVSLIEVLVAAVVVGIVMMALGGYITSTYGKTTLARDQAFANQRVLQMMEEMAAYKPPTPTSPGVEQFKGYSYVLTTTPNVSAGSTLSGNNYFNGHFKYVRQITVSSVSGDPKALLVTVSMWYTPKNVTAFSTDVTPSGSPPNTKPLAVVSNVLRGNGGGTTAQHVVDLYVISIENLPHVWARGTDTFCPSATEARQIFQASLLNLQTRYPGVSFRTHYISRLSIGRDKYYKPYINHDLPLDNQGGNGGAGGSIDPLNWVYFYPGRIEDDSTNTRYYDYQNIKGNFKLGSGSGSVTNSYPLCDEFNQAVRYPREFSSPLKNSQPVTALSYAADWNTSTAISNANAFSPPADPSDQYSLSLRQFLEDLLTDTTGKYRNAMIVNLHGELFPSLPLRNYADAAKDIDDTSAATQGRRVVTHPVRLSFEQGVIGSKVTLLTHAFMADGGNTPAGLAGTYGANVNIVIKGLKPYLATALGAAGGLTDVSADVLSVGGAPPAHTGNSYSWSPVTAVAGNSATYPGTTANDVVIPITSMFYDAKQQVANHNGGSTQPDYDYGIPQSSGVPDSNYLLDGLQYFPDPLLPFLDVNNNVNGVTNPRNTAHARVQFYLQSGAPSSFTVVTQLKKSNGVWPNVDSNEPANSRTWFYTAGMLSSLGNSSVIPATEQLQLVGDPRHNPYLEYRLNDWYNPYFESFRPGSHTYANMTHDDTSHPDKYLDAYNSYYIAPTDVTSRTVLAGGPTTVYDASYNNTADNWDGVKYNAPAYFQLWQKALLRNNMFFVNVEGEPVGLLGMGGDFDFGGVVDGYTTNLKLSKQPFTNQTGTAGADELFGGNTFELIQRTTNSPSAWHSLPWLGELFPPDESATWKANGNLSTGTAAGNDYFIRKDINGVTFDPATGSVPGGSKAVSNHVGFASFLNGAKSTYPVAIYNNNDQKSDLSNSTGQVMNTSLKLQLVPQQKADFFYGLGDSSANTPDEWATAPYSTHYILDNLNSSFSPPDYYKRSGQSSAASRVLTLQDSASPANTAFILANTFRPEDYTGVGNIMDIAAGTIAEAYYDATRQGLGATNNKPLPRLKITAPVDGSNLSGSQTITWYARWTRADVTPYRPGYNPAPSGYDPTQAVSSGGPLAVVYYLKFMDPGGVWHTAKTSVSSTDEATGLGLIPFPTITPVPDTGPINGNANAMTTTWDTSGLTPGTYTLRVEGFRQNNGYPADPAQPALPVNYAFHQITVNLY